MEQRLKESNVLLDIGEWLVGFEEAIKTLFLGRILRCAILSDDEHAGSHREDER